MAKPTPPANAVVTTVQIGTYSPLQENANSDGFTLLADLNDTVSTWIIPGSLKIPPPEKTWVESGNIRSPGVAVARWQYKNRSVDLSISIRGANYTALQTTIAAIKAAVENPPYTIRFAWPGASQYSYFDVVKCTHNLPSDPILWLNKALPHYEFHFECMPGIRGDRLTLQNLAVNPGFEAPAGGGTAQTAPVVFNDTFANVNAYAVQAGSAPTVTSNVMTLVAGAQVAFGSPAWGAIQTWQVRFQFLASQVSDWFLHFTNANNFLDCFVSAGSIVLRHVVGGTTHTLASGTITLTANNFYWIKLTQYPTVSGNPPMVEVQLFNDSSGAVGSAVASSHLGPVATFDAVTALVGRPQISTSGASLPIGGAFSNVHTVALFGPGGWSFNPLNSQTGRCSGAWDGSRGELGMSGTGGANTYPNGPVTSFGAARIDIAPAGTVDTFWNLYGGGAAAGTQAMPVSAGGNTVAASAFVKSTGLNAAATWQLNINEYTSSGTFIQTDVLQQTTGNLATWTKLSGTVATQATCAYVDVEVRLFDTAVAGESANGTAWIDNVQCYNQTATGQTSMPYCELRFPNSPSQLVVSGLLGDMPAPAWLAWGTYVSAWVGGTTLTLLLGRRATPAATGAGLVGVVTSAGQSGALDATAYGGFYSTLASSTIWFTAGLVNTASQAQGRYHLLLRAYTTDVTSPTTTAAVQPQVKQQLLNGTVVFWFVNPTKIFPFAAGNTWTFVDAGQVLLPPSAQGGLNDLTQLLYTAAIEFTDSVGPTWRAGALCLLPIDGSLLIGSLINPTTGTTVNTSWLWGYVDPTVGVGSGDTGGSWTLSTETTALPNAAHASGGPGSLSSLSPSINKASDAWLTLDPTLTVNASAGVNEMVAYLTDQTAVHYAVHGEIQYSPWYQWPR